MEVPIVIISAVLAILTAGGGWAFKFLVSEVKGLAECQNKCQENLQIRRETDGAVVVNHVDGLKAKLGGVEVWQARFEVLLAQNEKDREEMMNEIRLLTAEVKELSECVKLLSKGHKEC